MLFRPYLLIVLWIFSAFAVAEPLVIGRVSSNITKTVKSLEPIANLVQAHLGSTRFDSVIVRVAQDLNQLIAWVNAGEVHWVTESAFAASRLINEAGMTAKLARFKKGQHSYGSVLVSLSETSSLNDLLGKKIAAEDPDSFSGYFLIYMQLRESGLPINQLGNIRDQEHNSSVNIVFSNGEKNNLMWLKHGLVDAAIFSDLDYQDSKFFPDLLKSKTQPIVQTAQYPRALELFSRELDQKDMDAISNILLALEPTHPAMMQYDKSTGFRLTNKNELSLLNSIHSFYLKEKKLGHF